MKVKKMISNEPPQTINGWLRIENADNPHLQALSRIYQACPDSARAPKLIVGGFLPNYKPGTISTLIVQLRHRWPGLFPYKNPDAYPPTMQGKGSFSYSLKKGDPTLMELAEQWQRFQHYGEIAKFRGERRATLQQMISFYRRCYGEELFPGALRKPKERVPVCTAPSCPALANINGHCNKHATLFRESQAATGFVPSLPRQAICAADRAAPCVEEARRDWEATLNYEKVARKWGLARATACAYLSHLRKLYGDGVFPIARPSTTRARRSYNKRKVRRPYNRYQGYYTRQGTAGYMIQAESLQDGVQKAREKSLKDRRIVSILYGDEKAVNVIARFQNGKELAR